jgi:PAS domain S-box-containing protein
MVGRSLKHSSDRARLLGVSNETASEIENTRLEERLKRFTRLALRLFDTPIALITVLEAGGPQLIASQGLLPGEADQILSFCTYAALQNDPFVVPDTTADPRFSANPLVQREKALRFYAGITLVGSNTSKIGTLSILDYRPRHLDQLELDALQDLAALVQQELLRLPFDPQPKDKESSLADPQPVLAARESTLSLIYNTTSDSIFLVGVEEEEGQTSYRCLSVNNAYLETTGFLAEQILGKRIEEFLPPDTVAYVTGKYQQALSSAQPLRYEEQVIVPKGLIIVETTLTPIFDFDKVNPPKGPYLLGVARDVTEQRRAFQLQQRQTQYLAALHQTAVALMNRLELTDLLQAIVTRALVRKAQIPSVSLKL